MLRHRIRIRERVRGSGKVELEVGVNPGETRKISLQLLFLHCVFILGETTLFNISMFFVLQLFLLLAIDSWII